MSYYLAQIELTNNCNLYCKGCLRFESKRHFGMMAYETFLKSLEICKKRDVSEIWLHNWGEPTLHPHLLPYIAIAKKDKFKVGFVSNGTLLNPYFLHRLSAVGFDNLDLSWHFTTDHLLCKHLLDMYEMANKLKIDCCFRSVVFSAKEYDMLHEALKDYKVRWQRGIINDEIWFRQKPCPARKNTFVIYWDGTEIPCCRMTNGLDEKVCVHCREVQDDMPVRLKLE